MSQAGSASTKRSRWTESGTGSSCMPPYIVHLWRRQRCRSTGNKQRVLETRHSPQSMAIRSTLWCSRLNIPKTSRTFAWRSSPPPVHIEFLQAGRRAAKPRLIYTHPNARDSHSIDSCKEKTRTEGLVTNIVGHASRSIPSNFPSSTLERADPQSFGAACVARISHAATFIALSLYQPQARLRVNKKTIHSLQHLLPHSPVCATVAASARISTQAADAAENRPCAYCPPFNRTGSLHNAMYYKPSNVQ